MHNKISQVLQLDESETLEWMDQPSNEQKFETSDMAMVPFALLSFIFVNFMGYMIFQDCALFIFILLAFWLFSFYLLIGRFYFKRLINKNMYFILTTKQVIFLKTGKKKTHAFHIFLGDIERIQVYKKSSGRGNIELFTHNNSKIQLRSQPLANMGFNLGRQIEDRVIYAIPNVELVANKIQIQCGRRITNQ